MEAEKLKRIVIKEELFSITNDTFKAIILGQFIYWQARIKDYDEYLKEEKDRCLSDGVPFNAEFANGWIYKRAKDIIDECMLNVSESTIRKYIKDLEDSGYIKSRTNPLHKWDKVLQYRVDMKKVICDIKNNGYDGLSEWKLNNHASNLENYTSNLENCASNLRILDAIPETTISKTTNIDYNKNKEDTIVSKKVAKNEWRKDFDVYKAEVVKGRDLVLADEQYKKQITNMYPNIDYYRSVIKVFNFWITEKGWEYKKKSKTTNIDMAMTFKRNMDKSIVYKNRENMPIENKAMLEINIVDEENGTLEDGTIFKNGYRYYYSMKDKRTYSIPIKAPKMPNDYSEWDTKKNVWYFPRDNRQETIDDMLW